MRGVKSPCFGGIPGRYRKPYKEEDINASHCSGAWVQKGQE